ncbi:MAG: NAD(P)-dependent oxidoreductase [Robiginitomaculum sp.]
MPVLFLTGGTGYIGQAFLQSERTNFSTIIVPTRSADSFQDKNIQYIRTNGTSESLIHLLKKNDPDIVINCAAAGIRPDERDPNYLSKINSYLPVQLLQASRSTKVSRFIQIGSMAEYAPPVARVPLAETHPIGYENTYGTSKAAATLMLSTLAFNANIPLITLRLFGIYGPLEAEHRLTTQLLKKLRTGQNVPLSKGTQVRDFIYVKDAVEAMHRASFVDLPAKHHIINIGTGQGVSVRDFVMSLCTEGNFDQKLLKFGHLPMRDTDAPYLVADTRKAKTLLNWQARWTVKNVMPSLVSSFLV